jgi:hypothetical protein
VSAQELISLPLRLLFSPAFQTWQPVCNCILDSGHHQYNLAVRTRHLFPSKRGAQQQQHPRAARKKNGKQGSGVYDFPLLSLSRSHHAVPAPRVVSRWPPPTTTARTAPTTRRRPSGSTTGPTATISCRTATAASTTSSSLRPGRRCRRPPGAGAGAAEGWRRRCASATRR